MKTNIKTIRGYVNSLERLSKICPRSLKGYYKLHPNKQEEIIFISGDINNFLGDLK